jgi:hypothetical protein
MLTNNIVNSEEEKPRSPTYLEKGMIETNDEKETTPTTTKCTKDEIMDINEKKNHAMGYTKVKNRFQ